MRRLFTAVMVSVTLLSITMIPISSARTQGLNIEISDVEPITKLPPEKWIYLITHMINADPIIGKSSVYAINATGEDLSSVVCRGYFLVGTKPYITNNATTNAPASLPKWKATLIPTEGFNTYCKNGVDATGATSSYHGRLTAADQSFSESSFVIFWKPNGQ